MECVVRFKVMVPTDINESVWICGDSDKLGNQMHEHAVELEQGVDTPMEWRTVIRLPRDEPIEYLYFIKDGNTISRWESWSDERKRTLTPRGMEMYVDDGMFAVKQNDGAVQEHARWLASAYQLRLSLGEGETFSRKCSFTLSSQYSSLEVARIIIHSRTKHSAFKVVDLASADPNHEYEFFGNTLKDLELYVQFYSSSDTEQDPVGTAFVPTSVLAHLYNRRCEVPIIAPSMSVIGSFTFQFVVITPFTHESLSKVLHRSYWRSTKYVYMGHRGMGANKAVSKSGKKTTISENTILAFTAAAACGTNYVEFDVQLTSDKIPVIFHNYILPVTAESGLEFEVPVHSVTLEQFRRLHPTTTTKAARPRHSALKSLKRTASFSDVLPALTDVERGEMMSSKHHTVQERYPTLEEVFTHSPVDLGFDIEVKYPTEQHNAMYGLNYFERNVVCDRILQDVYNYAKSDRKIIFTSFDPDVCHMLSLKQPRFPVLFLTDGGMKHIKYDARRNSLESAVKFAKSANLLGIVSNARPLLMAPMLIRTIKRSGLVLFTWGDDNNEADSIRLQEENGVDGIISDHQLTPISDAAT